MRAAAAQAPSAQAGETTLEVTVSAEVVLIPHGPLSP
jgi:hypothetical protein